MSIAFHCSHCGRKVEAQDSAGGKWGKCPACHNKVYVPDLKADEELKLAPINKEDEDRKKQLIEETHKLEQDILLEREVPETETDSEPQVDMETIPEALMDAGTVGEQELMKNIIFYLRQMADGQLSQAQGIESLIISCGRKAVKILDEIALSEIPEPELADVPQQVLSALIRKLRAKIIN